MAAYYLDKDDDGSADTGAEYAGGLTLLESIEAKGYDTSDLGKLAEQARARGEHTPALPPLTDL